MNGPLQGAQQIILAPGATRRFIWPCVTSRDLHFRLIVALQSHIDVILFFGIFVGVLAAKFALCENVKLGEMSAWKLPLKVYLFWMESDCSVTVLHIFLLLLPCFWYIFIRFIFSFLHSFIISLSHSISCVSGSHTPNMNMVSLKSLPDLVVPYFAVLREDT